MSGFGEIVCPVCELPLTNPPARIDLPSGTVNVLVHQGDCERKGLTAEQIAAIEGRNQQG